MPANASWRRWRSVRASNPGKPLKSTTLQTYANLLTRLYLQGAKFPEVAIDDPFPGIAPPFSSA